MTMTARFALNTCEEAAHRLEAVSSPDSSGPVGTPPVRLISGQHARRHEDGSSAKPPIAPRVGLKRAPWVAMAIAAVVLGGTCTTEAAQESAQPVQAPAASKSAVETTRPAPTSPAAKPVAATKVKKTRRQQLLEANPGAKTRERSITGKMTALTKRAIAVELKQHAGSSEELLLPIDAQTRLVRLGRLGDLQRGDTVSVTYEQLYHEDQGGQAVVLQTIATEISLMRQAPIGSTHSSEGGAP